MAPQPRTGGFSINSFTFFFPWRRSGGAAGGRDGSGVAPLRPPVHPLCPGLGWAGDPGSPVLGPRARTGREFHEGSLTKTLFKTQING